MSGVILGNGEVVWGRKPVEPHVIFLSRNPLGKYYSIREGIMIEGFIGEYRMVDLSHWHGVGVEGCVCMP
jgi:hypothetical protein